MSGSGDDSGEYTAGNQQEGSYYSPFLTSSEPGLFGGQYADMQAQSAANGGLNWTGLAPPIDLSGDGTGLAPSVTVAPYLPQYGGPDTSLRAPSVRDDSLGLALPPGVQPIANAGSAEISQIPASFNAYGWLHDFLNRPLLSKMLQSGEDWSQSFERNGDLAAGIGAGTVGLGLLTADPFMATAGAGLFAIGETANKAGKVGDAIASFLKSVQQDNDGPSRQFVPRAGEPGYSDLDIPEP